MKPEDARMRFVNEWHRKADVDFAVAERLLRRGECGESRSTGSPGTAKGLHI
jgi:hypothetical protein